MLLHCCLVASSHLVVSLRLVMSSHLVVPLRHCHIVASSNGHRQQHTDTLRLQRMRMNSRIANPGTNMPPLENDKSSSLRSGFAAYTAKDGELHLEMNSGKLREKREARKTSERAQQEEFAIQMEELTMMNMALLARNPALVTTIKM